MAMLIPVNNDGNREILVDTGGGGAYRFRTYFTQGQMDGWYLDIRTTTGDALLLGKRIVPGCPNLLKGQGNNFRDVQLAAVVLNGSETTPGALGNGTYLYWFNPGETNPFNVGDPLIDIPYDEWAFGDKPSSGFFTDDGRGSIQVAGKISAGAVDSLFVIDADGHMRLKASVSTGTSNDYMTTDANGSVKIKG